MWTEIKQRGRQSLKGSHQCFPYVKSGFLLSNVGLDLCITNRGSGVCSRPRESLVSYGLEGEDVCFGLGSQAEVCSMQHAAGSIHACVCWCMLPAGGSSVLLQSVSPTGRSRTPEVAQDMLPRVSSASFPGLHSFLAQ